jgi:DNA polymerase-3 subunit delta
MVAVKASEVEGRIARLDPRAVVYLVYGPDSGLVSERAKTLADKAVDDPADPFQMVKLAGEDVAADPERLVDEANTIGLFGGRRVIWVKPTSRNLAPAVAPVLAAPPADTLIVVEAGDLNRTSPLRTMCEKSPAALALPCYADEGRTLTALVNDMLAKAGLGIDREARDTLLTLLGADRLATRNEVDKLALYARGRDNVTLDDVEAVVGDVSTLTSDAALDAAFAGDLGAFDNAFARLRAQAHDPGTLMNAALRHALTLLRARFAIEAGASIEEQVKTMRVNFRREDAMRRQLRAWTSGRLVAVVCACGEAVGEARKQPGLAAALAHKTLSDFARSAARAGR